MICKLHYHSLSSPPTPDGSGWWRNFHKEYYNSRTFRNPFLETSNAETNFGTNYIKHHAACREKTVITVTRNIWARSDWIPLLLLQPVRKQSPSSVARLINSSPGLIFLPCKNGFSNRIWGSILQQQNSKRKENWIWKKKWRDANTTQIG